MSRMRRVKRSRKIAAALAVLLIVGIIPLFNLGGASAAKTSNQVTFQDQQLVFMEQENSGEITGTRVIDWMQFDGNGNISVNAPTDLSKAPKAQGIRGFETAGYKDGSLVLGNTSVNGLKNVITQLTLSKDDNAWAIAQTPLKAEYSYWLDGVKYDNLKDMAGKSGHFRLELKLTNTSKKMQDVTYTDSTTGQKKTERVETYMPLVIQPYDWYFDNAVFSNVTADDTGLVFGMPTVYQLGWSIPLFPPATDPTNTIWMEADVKDFSMDPLTLAIAFVLPKTNQKDPLPEIASGLTELYGGVDQLGAGIQEAAAGVGATSTDNTLLFGINQIANGLTQLASPTAGLPAANSAITGQLMPGINQLIAGVGTTANPTSISGGLAQIAAGIGSASTDQTLLFAINGLIAGLESVKANIGSAAAVNTLLYAANAVLAGLADLKTGIVAVNAASAPTGPLVTNLQAALALAADSANIATITAIINGVVAAISGSGPTAIYGGTNIALAGLGSTSTPGTLLYGAEAVVGGLMAIKAGIGSGTTADTLLFAANAISAGLTSIKAAIGTTATPDTLLFGSSSIFAGLSQVQGGLGQVSGGLSEATAGLGSASTANTLIFGADQIEGGLSTLKAGLDTAFTSGTEVMKEALGTNLHQLNLTFGELKAIEQRGNDFDSFLGRPDNATSSEVRFVMQTKPVQASWTGSSWVLALVLSILAVIALVLLGLFAFRKFA